MMGWSYAVEYMLQAGQTDRKPIMLFGCRSQRSNAWRTETSKIIRRLSKNGYSKQGKNFYSKYLVVAGYIHQ